MKQIIEMRERVTNKELDSKRESTFASRLPMGSELARENYAQRLKDDFDWQESSSFYKKEIKNGL